MTTHGNSRSHFWLYVGAGSVAATLGYMVGASNSPVVAGVIPAVFGLLAVAIGMVKAQTHTPKPKEHGPEETPPMPTVGLRTLGIMLTLVAVTYLVATIVGSRVRTSAYLGESTPFPWTDNNQPKSTQTALQWLVVQKRLVTYGYTLDQVRQIYELSQSKNALTDLTVGGELLDFVPEPGSNLKKDPAAMRGLVWVEK